MNNDRFSGKSFLVLKMGCERLYGKFLKKRGLEAFEAKAKSLLQELTLWLKTMSD